MKGITVTLYERSASGTDALGNPTYTESPVSVDNVLIGEPSTDDVANATALYQKVIRYMLGIPKGDTHNWTDARVEWTDRYGTHAVRTFGYPILGIEANVPTPWHMKVRCEDYGG